MGTPTRKRILLVEDHPVTAEVMQQALELIGYDVMVASNGVVAVEMATRELPDAIVMDVFIPQLDGFEAASRIRKNSKTQSIPILIATAKPLAGEMEKYLPSGCSAYIAKPFTHKDLDAAVKKLLRMQSQRI